jgi:hypothetical protein
MDGLDAECDAITHERSLLLDNAMNQSRVYEVPAGGTWVGLAVLRIFDMVTLTKAPWGHSREVLHIKLITRGKPKKLALVACMRKLLTILNDMVRRETHWDQKQKSVADSAVAS